MIRSFTNDELNAELQTVTKNGDIYFKAKEVATILGYQDTKDAIKVHVPDNYKVKLADLDLEVNRLPYRSHPHSLYLSEPGLYALIFRSHLPSAEKFRRWVFEEVLPTLRKTGTYTVKRKKYNPLVFKIENETDLHNKVVDYIRRFHPELLIIAGLGELQDTSFKRITSWKKGYQKGQPDIIIMNCHKKYSGFCLELKTPQGNGVTSDAQKKLLEKYEHNGFKVMICNDYDLIIREIESHCLNIRIPCPYCCKKFVKDITLKAHLRWFHRISEREISNEG